MQNELYHYGVKGMRWGVRRTKHQLSLEKKARLQIGYREKWLMLEGLSAFMSTI